VKVIIHASGPVNNNSCICCFSTKHATF